MDLSSENLRLPEERWWLVAAHALRGDILWQPPEEEYTMDVANAALQLNRAYARKPVTALAVLDLIDGATARFRSLVA